MPGSWCLIQWQREIILMQFAWVFLSCSYTEYITWMNTFSLWLQFPLPPLSQGYFHIPIVMRMKTKVSYTCFFSRTKEARETKIFISLSHSLHNGYKRVIHWHVLCLEKKFNTFTKINLLFFFFLWFQEAVQAKAFLLLFIQCSP